MNIHTSTNAMSIKYRNWNLTTKNYTDPNTLWVGYYEPESEDMLYNLNNHVVGHTPEELIDIIDHLFEMVSVLQGYTDGMDQNDVAPPGETMKDRRNYYGARGLAQNLLKSERPLGQPEQDPEPEPTSPWDIDYSWADQGTLLSMIQSHAIDLLGMTEAALNNMKK